MVPRILHAAFLGGTVLVLGILVVLRRTAPPVGGPDTDSLRYLLLGLGGLVVFGFRAIRARIEPPAGPGDEAAWWRANLGLVIVSSALADSLALAAGVVYYLSADPVALGVAAVGLALLLVARPTRPIGG